MKKIKEITQKYANNENLITMMVLVVLLQPIIDIDYLLYPYLDPIGLPLPSTIIYFIGFPIVIVLAFLIKEQNKKKVLLFASFYLALVTVYFIAHHLIVKDMFELLYLTNRYKYTLVNELKYVLTLIIPFGLIYAFFRAEFNQSIINKIVIWSSILIAFPIFFSNLLLFGQSTYYPGPTMANFPTWFMGIYDKLNPKMLATRFFFSEGNTTGIVLFAIYPVLIRQFFTSSRKWLILVLVIIQGWAMLILATRVATYGAPLMIAVVLGVWLFLVVLKKEKFNWKNLVILSTILLMFVAALPFTPAVKNLEVDNRNNQLVVDDEDLRQQFKEDLNDEGLIPGSAEFNFYYQNIFENYYWLLTISEEYYKWFYPYVIDPKFYVDLIFEYDFWERQSGRQFQQIFFDYKWDKLNDTQKLFGFGYSRFMMGSILLEQDFLMQKYTLGYLGTVILTFPWLGLLIYMLYQVVRNIKKACNFDLIVYGVAFGAILGGAYMSGHVLDQFFSSTFLALFAGIILYKLNQLKKED